MMEKTMIITRETESEAWETETHFGPVAVFTVTYPTEGSRWAVWGSRTVGEKSFSYKRKEYKNFETAWRAALELAMRCKEEY